MSQNTTTHAPQMLRICGPGRKLAVRDRRATFAVWCGREDSNLHALRRYHLKVVRLPIPPRPLTIPSRPRNAPETGQPTGRFQGWRGPNRGVRPLQDHSGRVFRVGWTNSIFPLMLIALVVHPAMLHQRIGNGEALRDAVGAYIVRYRHGLSRPSSAREIHSDRRFLPSGLRGRRGTGVSLVGRTAIADWLRGNFGSAIAGPSHTRA